MANLETYPPPYRNQPENDGIDLDLDENMMIRESDQLPIIDLHALNMKSLNDTCKNWGVVRLVNHGIPSTLLTKLEEIVANFFNISFESKQTLFDNLPVSYFWGTPALTSSGTAVPVKNPSRLEGFNVPLCHLSQLEQAEDPAIASFRILMEEYGNHLARISRTIFEAMVTNLNLDPIKTRPYLSEHTAHVRLHRYPFSRNLKEQLSLDEHTNSSVLTILAQDKIGGVEVLKDDKWIVAEPTLDSLILTLGDMMQAISNDEYKSVTLRVKTRSNCDGKSICYYVGPEGECVINSSKYRPFTFKEFQAQVHQDVQTLGFKVGLQKFRISKTS